MSWFKVPYIELINRDYAYLFVKREKKEKKSMIKNQKVGRCQSSAWPLFKNKDYGQEK